MTENQEFFKSKTERKSQSVNKYFPFKSFMTEAPIK